MSDVFFTAAECARLGKKGETPPWTPAVKEWFYPLRDKVRELGEECLAAEYSGPVDVSLHVSQPNQASRRGAIASWQAFCDIYPSRSPLNPSIKMNKSYCMQIYFRLTRFGAEVGLCWGAWQWQGTRSELASHYEQARDWMRGRLSSLPDDIRDQLAIDVSSAGYRYVDKWASGGKERTYAGLQEWLDVACSDKGKSHAIIRSFQPWELDDLGTKVGDLVREAVEIFSPVFNYVQHDPDAPLVQVVQGAPPLTRNGKPGKRYKKAKEDGKSTYNSPFDRDPDAIDRANNSHAKLQNDLAEFVRKAGYEPMSPEVPDTPNYDLAWYWGPGPTLVVAEVKSITDDNETSQLRHGLGQVLHYKSQILNGSCGASQPEDCLAVLAVEREPRDPIWEDVCRRNHVKLVWPGEFMRCFDWY